MQRCHICDCTDNVHLRNTSHGLEDLCDDCFDAVSENIEDLTPEEDLDFFVLEEEAEAMEEEDERI